MARLSDRNPPSDGNMWDEKTEEEWDAYLEERPELAEKVRIISSGMRANLEKYQGFAEAIRKADLGLEKIHKVINGIDNALHRAHSEWPEVGDEIRYATPGETALETWKFYGRILSDDGIKAWPLLEGQESYLEEQIRLAGEDEAREQDEELENRIGIARLVYRWKLRTLRRLMRHYMLTFTVPELSREEAEEIENINPFEGTRSRYDNCRKLLDAYDGWAGSGRVMEQMGDLWREVGTDAGKVEKASRDALKSAGFCAGNGYEGGNPESYVEAVRQLVEDYDAER